MAQNALRRISIEKYLDLLPSLKEESTQKFANVALTLIALPLFSIFAIGPTLSTIAHLNKELEDSRFVDSKLQDKITNLGILRQKYSNLQGDLPFVFSALPQEPIVSLLTAQIQGLAQSANVTVKNINLSETELANATKKKDASVLPTETNKFTFNIDVQGTYPQVSTFITLLSKFQRIVTIESVGITKIVESDQDVRLSVAGTAYLVN